MKNGSFPKKSTCLLYSAVLPEFYNSKVKVLYVLVGYFILILKKCIKCMYRWGSSQCSP